MLYEVITVMMLFGRVGIRSLWVYALVGLLFVWYPMLKSGVHATVAGVMIAFTIPIHRRFDANSFVENMRQSLDAFHKNSTEEQPNLLSHTQYGSVEQMEQHCIRNNFV